MVPPEKKLVPIRYSLVFSILFLLNFIIYSNTFKASWHLDDYQNILWKSKIKISSLNPQAVYKSFAKEHINGLDTKKLSRLIPQLTFAVNWYFGQDNVFGYHLVNILIHILTVFILFLTTLNLFYTPNLKAKYSGSEHFIALLAATLWAINPIQIQSVTYIVQRIAAMAAMFYILGMYFYLKARLDATGTAKIFYFSGCLISFLLALASKENAVIFPLTLILVEIVFFQDMGQPQTRRRFVGVAVVVGLFILIIGSWFFLYGDISRILNAYQNRSFSPPQRLMTEPRILLFYLSLIFYPIPTRLSIDHDVVISTSAFSPWNTLPSILIISMLIGVAFFRMRTWPLFSFSIIFFFLNHLIESSIIGLELIFEHRNYLPSFFLFLPVAAVIKKLLDLYCRQKPFLHMILVCFVTLVILGIGIGTYVRNLVWATEKSLWEDALNKAAGTTRPYHNLAWAYYEKTGQLDMAMKLYEKALDLRMHSKQGKSLLLNNMANIHYRRGAFERACEVWKTTVALNPGNGLFQYRLAKCLTDSGDLDNALVYLDEVIAKYPFYGQAHKLKGTILINQNKAQASLRSFKQALKLDRNDREAMIKLGIGYRLLGACDRAEWYFKSAFSRNSADISTLVWLIETNLATGDRIQSQRYSTKLFESAPIDVVISALRKPDFDLLPPASRMMLMDEIAAKLKKHSETLDHQ